jgi:hypothetical protein
MCAVVPAKAAESDFVSADATSTALISLDSELLLAPAEGAGLGTVDLTHGTVEIPATPATGIAVESTRMDLTIGLPGAHEAGHGIDLDGGTVTYPGDGFSNSVIASEAGLQLLTTIAGPDAPTRYEYPIDLPADAVLQDAGGGMFVVADGDGHPVLIILPAWAKEANGADVPTRYALEGETLVQYVDHARAGVEYPVVADPKFEWWGVLPSVKLTRNETYQMRYASVPAKVALCVKAGNLAAVALALPCALSVAVLAVKAGSIYANRKCLRVVIGPGVLGGVEYKDKYCK